MSDARSTTEDAIHHLDRLASAILDDVGDGPAPAVFAAISADVAAAIAAVGVAAFNEVTGLIAGVAGSITGGAIDWSPALGGTLIAAVDDLRAMVGRASRFSAEDSEHLHHRALELAPYVKVAPRGANSSATASPTPAPTPPPQPAPAPAPEPQRPVSASNDSPAAKKPDPVIPISELFYAEGPGIVSGGVPKSAAALSEMLGAGVDSLERNLIDKPLAAATSGGPLQIVPVETLIYRGRAALERAAELRDRIKSAGGSATPATLDEMYDLIGLALKE